MGGAKLAAWSTVLAIAACGGGGSAGNDDVQPVAAHGTAGSSSAASGSGGALASAGSAGAAPSGGSAGNNASGQGGGGATSNAGAGGDGTGGGGGGATSGAGGVATGGAPQSGGSAGATSGAGGSADDFPTQFANAVCGVAPPCCAAQSAAFVASDCFDIEKLFAQFNFVPENGTVDPTQGAACIAAATKATMECVDSEDTYWDLWATCKRLVAGTVPAGGSCASDRDCAFPPDGDATCHDGTCVGHVRKKAGEACNASCLQHGCVFVDLVQPAEEQQCFAEDHLWCGPSGTCEPLPKLGDACTASVPMGSPWCDDSWCDPMQSKCVARLAVGSSCGNDWECQPGLLCSLQGTCIEPLALGAPCDTTTPPCEHLSVCVDGHCGGSFVNSSQCHK